MEWVSVKNKVKPIIGKPVICYCPEWCDSEYQIAYWNGSKFTYDEQSNNMFNDLVISWNIFIEAD